MLLLRPLFQSTTIFRSTISPTCFRTSPLQAIRNLSTSTAYAAPYHARSPSVRQHFLRNTLILTGTATTAHLALHSRQTTYNDSSPASDFSSSAYSHGKDAKVPLSKDGGRTLNPAAIRRWFLPLNVDIVTDRTLKIHSVGRSPCAEVDFGKADSAKASRLLFSFPLSPRLGMTAIRHLLICSKKI